MTQLARPDLARNTFARGDARPELAIASVPAALPAGSERERLLPRAPASPAGASLAAPRWAVASAVLSPVALVSGWLIADALQPASYSPVHQTMSVMAGQAGTDRWVMTTALFLVGLGQIVTASGLTGIRAPARVLLLATGLSSIGIAASPEPVTGPTTLHLGFAVSCAVTAAAWPAFVARRTRSQPWVMGIYAGVIVTAVFAALCIWLLIESQGGTELGLVERLTSSVQALPPLIVSLALRPGLTDEVGQTDLAPAD